MAGILDMAKFLLKKIGLQCPAADSPAVPQKRRVHYTQIIEEVAQLSQLLQGGLGYDLKKATKTAIAIHRDYYGPDAHTDETYETILSNLEDSCDGY